MGCALVATAVVVAVVTPSAASSAGVPLATGSVVAPASAADGVWGTFTALGTGMNGNVYTLAASDDTLYARWGVHGSRQE